MRPTPDITRPISIVRHECALCGKHVMGDMRLHFKRHPRWAMRAANFLHRLAGWFDRVTL